MAHEDLNRLHAVEGSSDRMFGLVFAAVFALVAAWPLFFAAPARWWAIVVAAAFAAAALLKPALLRTLNRQWTRLGIALGKLVSPVALGVLYYGILTPIGALARIAGKDPLRLRRDPGCDSYWIRRVPPGPPPGSLNNQF